MELKWLEDFLVLSNTLNFSRAADARNITQPAFGRRIRSLEMWLGAALFNRSTFPITLTADGIAFRNIAEETVQLLYRAREECHGRSNPRRAMISFAAPHTIALNFFPSWICRLEEQFGPIHSRLEAENVHDSVQALMAGSCDFLISYFHPAGAILIDAERYPSLLLSTEYFMPVSIPGAYGCPKWDLDASTSKSVPMLAYSPATFFGRMVDLILEKNHCATAFDSCYENSMADALKSMALQGLGVAWIPQSCMERELRERSLVAAGDGRWVLPLDIRLYRAADKSRRNIEKFWSFIASV